MVVLYVLIGTLLGFLSGLGTGGGSLLVLWLTLVLQTPPAQARLINLMFFLPCALVATLINWRKGRVSFQKLLLPALSGCVMAAVFSIISKNMDTEQLKSLFGVLLIFIGIRELFYRPRKPK